MPAATRLKVVLCWHMHQPEYRDLISGEALLPWTYLHAIKDYSDMAAHLESVPGATAVVNFSPVLLLQLEEYASQVAAHRALGEPLRDSLLATLTPAGIPDNLAAREQVIRECLRGQSRAHRRALRALQRSHGAGRRFSQARRGALRGARLPRRSHCLVPPGMAG